MTNDTTTWPRPDGSADVVVGKIMIGRQEVEEVRPVDAWSAELVNEIVATAVQESPAVRVLAHIRRSVRNGIVQIHEGSATMADIDAALAHLTDKQMEGDDA